MVGVKNARIGFNPSRHAFRTRHLFTCAAFCAAAASVVAQEPLLFHGASSDLVVLTAAVTDANGGFVPDVPRQSFAILDEGKPRPIALFSDDDSPVSVGLVIDNSASMRPKMGEVIAATLEFARMSNPSDELFALSFNDSVQEVLHDRRFLMADDAAELEKAVSAMRPEGQTALYDAVMAGIDRLAEGSRPRKVLVVLSDGGDNASHTTLEDLLARARQSDATIYTIGLFDGADRDRNPGVLQALSRATGGERFLPASAGPLIQACARIASDIRSGYTIAFEPAVRDGRYHKIEVRVDRADGRRLAVRARTGYVAPGSKP